MIGASEDISNDKELFGNEDLKLDSAISREFNFWFGFTRLALELFMAALAGVDLEPLNKRSKLCLLEERTPGSISEKFGISCQQWLQNQ